MPKKISKLNVLALVYALIPLTAFASNQKGVETIKDTFNQIRSEKYLFDVHGNACPAVQDLMIARFDATTAIEEEIEKSIDGTNKEYVGALFAVLGFTKDPASIAWLEKVWKRPSYQNGLKSWLNGWDISGFYGASEEQRQWLIGEREWRAFFAERFESEKDSKVRFEILRTLTGWFGDTEMDRLAEKINENPSSGSKERLLSSLYLYERMGPYDKKALRAAIGSLGSSEQGLLAKVAYQFHDEAFIPILLDFVREPGKAIPSSALVLRDLIPDPELILEGITFELDIHGYQQWKTWFDRHGGEGKTTWRTRAETAFLETAKKNIAVARKLLKNAVYRWRDPCFYDFFDGLARHKEFANEVIGWINLSYHPSRREKWQRLAKKVIDYGYPLDEWATNLLIHNLHFLPGYNKSWMTFVRQSNMRF